MHRNEPRKCAQLDAYRTHFRLQYILHIQHNVTIPFHYSLRYGQCVYWNMESTRCALTRVAVTWFGNLNQKPNGLHNAVRFMSGCYTYTIQDSWVFKNRDAQISGCGDYILYGGAWYLLGFSSFLSHFRRKKKFRAPPLSHRQYSPYVFIFMQHLSEGRVGKSWGVPSNITVVLSTFPLVPGNKLSLPSRL